MRLLLREENRFLREELDRVMGKVKDMEEQMSLVRMAILQGSVVGAATTSIAPTARVEVPKPNAFHGGRNAKEIDNFLWSLEQYFRALGITEDARKIDHAPLYLADTAMVWWRRRLLDIERGNIREYVKEFMETLLEIPDYPDTEALFAFTDGLQNWARLEIERRGARDLATAVSIAESLIELHRRERNSSPQKERNEGSSSHGRDGSYRPYKPKEGHNKVQKEDQARNVKVRIGDWKGTLDFFVVSMDEYQCVLGVEFIDRVKAIPMLFANSICITEGGGTYMVPVLRGKPSPSKTLATMHMEVQKPPSTTTAVVQGKEQHGKGGGTPKSGPKECEKGNTPKLLKGHPPRRKVDCARGKSVARSPGDVALPRQESPRQSCSRGSRRRCKAEGRAGAPSHKDEEGTEAQLEQARGNQVEHGRRHGRKSKRRGRRWD
ncbi:hypothetical protein GH714_022329 [Hevea brasiliensis]|uniref:Retrotransposon gag domain-containing protein n=1 Tax=Hevea brasiliensis TaxID=3981 RepID=A0A6A6NII0_HEVBR|nr:hypothetical protein GH714_022329 [Hevea brasiliensis]